MFVDDTAKDILIAEKEVVVKKDTVSPVRNKRTISQIGNDAGIIDRFIGKKEVIFAVFLYSALNFKGKGKARRRSCIKEEI